MALDKEQVQDLIDDFVMSNDSDIERVSKENKALYDAVIAGLTLLSNRFGTGHTPTPVHELKPQVVIDEEEEPKPTKKSSKKASKQAKPVQVAPPQEPEEEFSEAELMESIEGLELLAEYDDESKEELRIAKQKLNLLRNKNK
jgi:hypothetical protein